MRQTLIVLLSAAAMAAAAPCPAGYHKYIHRTIDHTKVGSGVTQAIVVWCFNGNGACAGANTDLKSAANGGLVQNTVSSTQVYTHTIPADLVTASSTGSAYAHLIKKYVASTGEIYGASLATVSSAADTDFNVCFDNPAVSTDQSQPNSVWDANYKVAVLWPDGSTLDQHDWTANANNLSTANGTPTATTLDYDGAVRYDGQTGTNAGSSTSSDVPTNSAYTWGALVQFTNATSSSIISALFQQGGGTSDSYGFSRDHTSAGAQNAAYHQKSNHTYVSAQLASFPGAGVLTYLTGRWDGSTVLTIFRDGASSATGTVDGTMNSVVGHLFVGRQSGGFAIDAKIAEFEISNNSRSDAYVLTQANCWLHPDTMFATTSGTLDNTSSAPIRHRVIALVAPWIPPFLSHALEEFFV